MSFYNPPVYEWEQLMTMTPHELQVAQYQLQLASTSLLFALIAIFVVVLLLRWILPKYWYKRREVD